MRRQFILVLIALTTLWMPVAAQPTAPDYAIRNIRPPRFSDDRTDIIVEFEVVNSGTAAAAQATVLMFLSTGEEIARQTLEPLTAGQVVPVALTFPADLFEPGSSHSLQIAVGIDEIESSESETLENNFARTSVTIPTPGEAILQPESTPELGIEATAEPGGIFILGQEIDFSNPVTIAVGVGIIGTAFILLLILILIIRLLFQRPPSFGTWQPPYGNMPWLDPNTPAGRRQGWQQHAQSDSPAPPPGGEGATHVRKLLTGMDGVKLANWRVTGIRLSQYDQYGRVARSEVIASRRLANRINGVIKRAPSLNQDQLMRRLSPIAKSLVSQFRKKITPRNAMLPLALDIRLQGGHGEVRIFFELYIVQHSHWRIVDQWEPEMTVTGKLIQESFTYTLYGLYPGEPFKDFPRRLQNDLIQTLVEMLKPASSASQDTPSKGMNRVT